VTSHEHILGFQSSQCFCHINDCIPIYDKTAGPLTHFTDNMISI